jgi:predicted dienelactone hydrolase
MPVTPSSDALARNRIDALRADAPELAHFGPHETGVRTLTLVARDAVDVVAARAGEPAPRGDRALVVEVWYPAATGGGRSAYEAVMHGATPITLSGRAGRGARALRPPTPYPLVILSHGYPGNRYLLAHFGENLASKGYVVASIDHTDSTYADVGPFGFGSTLLHRPLDQLFVLAEMARLADDGGSFLHGLVDADRTGIIGYSMGGYGALVAAGGGLRDAFVGSEYAPPNALLRVHGAGSPELAARRDDRVRAVIAIGPWGMDAGAWDEHGLAGIRAPLLLMAGELDDVSGYETGVRAVFEASRRCERLLLTFERANHNAAAPIPAPVEMAERPETFEHHADPVWDTLRMNNVAQHFATAFFGLHLRNDATMAPYLDLVEDAAAGVVDVDEGGAPTARHTAWRGFAPRTAAGLLLRRASASD